MIVGNVSHLRRRMYHVKQLQRRSGNSTYCKLPAVRRAQADRRQGPERDCVGERAGLTPIGIQDGCPGGWRLMATGTVLLLALVHDDAGDSRRRAHAGTMTVMMIVPRSVRLINVLYAQSARALTSVGIVAGARSGLGLVGRRSRLRWPPVLTFLLNALGTVIATDRPSVTVAHTCWADDDSASGGRRQQATSLLRGPIGLDLWAIRVMLMMPNPDDVRIRIVGHDVLLFRHSAHSVHATDRSAEGLVVDSISLLWRDGFVTVARFVADAAADTAVVIAVLGVHGCMTISVDTEALTKGQWSLLLF